MTYTPADSRYRDMCFTGEEPASNFFFRNELVITCLTLFVVIVAIGAVMGLNA